MREAGGSVLAAKSRQLSRSRAVSRRDPNSAAVWAAVASDVGLQATSNTPAARRIPSRMAASDPSRLRQQGEGPHISVRATNSYATPMCMHRRPAHPSTSLLRMALSMYSALEDAVTGDPGLSWPPGELEYTPHASTSSSGALAKADRCAA